MLWVWLHLTALEFQLSSWIFFLLSLHNFSRWEKGERREEEGAREKPGGWPNVEETRNFTKAYWYGEKKNPREC